MIVSVKMRLKLGANVTGGNGVTVFATSGSMLALIVALPPICDFRFSASLQRFFVNGRGFRLSPQMNGAYAPTSAGYRFT
jgi:hypothetical protein